MCACVLTRLIERSKNMKKTVSLILSLLMVISAFAAVPFEANAIPTWYEFWHGSNQPIIDKDVTYRFENPRECYEDGILYFTRPYGSPSNKNAKDTQEVDVTVEYRGDGNYYHTFKNVKTPYRYDNPLDVKTYMDSQKFPTGYYYFDAVDKDIQIFWEGDSTSWYKEKLHLKRSIYGQFEYISPYETLDAPSYLRWEGNTCKWETVENATGYSVRFYDENGYWTHGASVTSTQYTFKDVTDGCYFAVKAESNGDYLESPLAVSPKKKSYTLTLYPNYNHGSTSMAAQVINNVSGKYVLPQTTEYTPADGYKFVGWSLTQSGDEIITSLDMNEHKAVYAIWKKYTASIGADVYYNLDGSDLYIYGSGAMYNYTQGSPNPSPFYNNTSITSVYIAGGVTSIGDRLFCGCSNLETVYLENATDLTTIGSGAFMNCSNIERIDYPGDLSEEIQYINANAFENCSKLKEFRIPSNVQYIAANAFLGCTDLKYITIPKSLKTISSDVFKGCSSLTDIFYSGSAEEWEAVNKNNNLAVLSYANVHPYTAWGVPIGAKAFYTVDAFGQRGTISGSGATFDYEYSKSPLLQRPVQEITVEGTITRIGDNLFSGLEALSTLTIEDGVKTIGSGALRDCNNLYSINIPDSVTSIESYATAWCGNLDEIYLGSGVKNIGNHAFWGSNAQKLYYNGSKELFDAITITDEESNSSLLNATFCSIAGSWGDNVTYRYDPEEKTLTFSGTGDMTEDLKGSHKNRPWYNYRDEIKHAVVEDGVTSVGGCCFMETAITDVELPDSITKFGTSAFLRCTDLKQIVIPEKVKKIETSDFNYCTALTDVVLNDGLETIGLLAFMNCTALKNINIPESATSIMGQSFSGCWALQDFAMPSKAKKIEFYTFYASPNLKSVYIPKSVTEIETGAFWECTSLSDIYYEGSSSDWKKISIDYANGYNDILKTVKIHYNCTSVSSAKITGIKSKTYSGKAQTQSPVVKMNGVTLKKGTDYKLTYKNNTKVGTATVTITGIGTFKGSVKKTFKINPKGTSLSSVSKGKKAFTVKWKKQSTQTTGYQLEYSTDKNFSKNCKKVTVSSTKTTKKTISKLKGGKKYYVRIRTYKTVSGTKYYSSWSSAKSVTTKK